MNKELPLTTKESAAFTGMSESAFLKASKKLQIPIAKDFGGCLSFWVEDLEPLRLRKRRSTRSSANNEALEALQRERQYSSAEIIRV